MANLGKELGLEARNAQDTRGRLRDDFEAVDYFEHNAAKIGFNAYNILVDKTYITGSTFILGHSTKGQLDDDLLGFTAGAGSSISRVIESKIWDEWEEDFTTTGSKDTTVTSVNWTTTGSCVFSVSTVSSALTGYWKFDNNTLAEIGSDWWSTGISYTSGYDNQSAVLINPTSANSYMVMNDYDEFAGNSGSQFSAACWLKTTDSTAYIFNHYNTSGKRSWAIRTDAGSFNVLLSGDGLYSTKSKNYHTTSDINILDNAWHHVGFSFNNNSLKLYVDGIITGSILTKNDTVYALYNTDTSFTIGLAWAGSPSYQTNLYTGSIDNAMFWSRELSATEFSDLYSGGVGGGGVAQSTKLSLNWSNLEISTLDKMKLTWTGSYLGSAIIYGSLNGGTNWTQMINKLWTTFTNTGSHPIWKATDSSGSAILYNIKAEWKSNDI